MKSETKGECSQRVDCQLNEEPQVVGECKRSGTRLLMASCVTRTRIGQCLRLACPYSERRRQVWTDLGPAGFFHLVYQPCAQWKSISCERHIDALQSRGSPRRGRHFLNRMNRVRSTFSFQKQKYCLFYDIYSIRGASWKTLLFCSRRAWLKKNAFQLEGSVLKISSHL